MAKLTTGNIKIPVSLMGKIICALECLEPDLDEYGPNMVRDHGEIVLALNNLIRSIELRDDYTRFIKDTSVDMRWQSHMEYAQYKRDEAELPF